MNIQFSLNLLGNYTMDRSALPKEQNKEPSLPQDQIEQELLTEDQGEQQHLPEDLGEQQHLLEDLGEQQHLPEDQNVQLSPVKGIDGATLVIIIIHKSQLDHPIIPYCLRGG